MNQNVLLLEGVLKDVENGSSKQLKQDWWMKYFAEQNLLTEDQLNERKRLNHNYEAVQALRSLQLGK